MTSGNVYNRFKKKDIEIAKTIGEPYSPQWELEIYLRLILEANKNEFMTKRFLERQ